MSEELALASQKLLMSVITLGVFCLVSVAYSMYVLLARPTDQIERESRVRAIMLAGVTVMSGAILVLGLRELGEAYALFESLQMQVPAALRLVGTIHETIPAAAAWAVVAVVTLIAVTPVFVRDAAVRTRLNRATAGLNFSIALLLMLLATALYGAYRIIEMSAAGGR